MFRFRPSHPCRFPMNCYIEEGRLRGADDRRKARMAPASLPRHDTAGEEAAQDSGKRGPEHARAVQRGPKSKSGPVQERRERRAHTQKNQLQAGLVRESAAKRSWVARRGLERPGLQVPSKHLRARAANIQGLQRYLFKTLRASNSAQLRDGEENVLLASSSASLGWLLIRALLPVEGHSKRSFPCFSQLEDSRPYGQK